MFVNFSMCSHDVFFCLLCLVRTVPQHSVTLGLHMLHKSLPAFHDLSTNTNNERWEFALTSHVAAYCEILLLHILGHILVAQQAGRSVGNC